MGIIMSNGIVYGGSGGGGSASIIELTKNEYDALSAETKNNGNLYYITDATEDYAKALEIQYDNQISKLSAVTVQDAIDEVSSFGSSKTMTKAEYDKLSEEEKNNGTTYYITDDSIADASDVYHNGKQVSEELDEIQSNIISLNDTTNLLNKFKNNFIGSNYYEITGGGEPSEDDIKNCLSSIVSTIGNYECRIKVLAFTTGTPRTAIISKIYDSIYWAIVFNGIQPTKVYSYENGTWRIESLGEGGITT